MTVRAVLLDLDDTLLPDWPAVVSAFRATCRRAAERYPLDPERLRRTIRRTARRRWWASDFGVYGRTFGLSSWEPLWGAYENGDEEYVAFGRWAKRFRRRAWEDALRYEGVDDPRLAADCARMFARERRRRLRPFADAWPLIESLRDDHAVALVTNGPDDQQRVKLARSGLDAAALPMITSGEVGVKKPDPKPFLVALERLEATPDEAIVVGNSLESDVAGAHAAGIRAIWLDRIGRGVRDGEETPDAIVRSLDEVPALLRPGPPQGAALVPGRSP